MEQEGGKSGIGIQEPRKKIKAAANDKDVVATRQNSQELLPGENFHILTPCSHGQNLYMKTLLNISAGLGEIFIQQKFSAVW